MMHRELHRLHVDMHTDTHIERVDPGVVTAYNVWDPSHKERFEVDTVVLCSARVSDDELYRELKADQEALQANGVESLYLIGDAAAPRMIVDCIFDGHRLAREIDSPNPAVPLPFIRERRLWSTSTHKEFDVQLLAKSDMAPMA